VSRGCSRGAPVGEVIIGRMGSVVLRQWAFSKPKGRTCMQPAGRTGWRTRRINSRTSRRVVRGRGLPGVRSVQVTMRSCRPPRRRWEMATVKPAGARECQAVAPWGGLAVDVPWGGPAVWGDLCELSSRVPLWCAERAGERCQGSHGARAVRSGRQPCLALLGEAAARADVMEVGMLWQWSPPGRQDARQAGQRRAEAARGCGQACARLCRGRAQALGGEPGRGAAQGAQRFWHGAGEQAGRPRQLVSARVGQPRRGCLRLPWWTGSLATGMGAVMMWSTTCAGREARAVGAGAAAAEGVKGLGGRGRAMGRALAIRWSVGGDNGAHGAHDASPRMRAVRRGTASACPVGVRGRESRVVARCAWPRERGMARRLPPAASRGVASACRRGWGPTARGRIPARGVAVRKAPWTLWRGLGEVARARGG
jgi:hypothetical protein